MRKKFDSILGFMSETKQPDPERKLMPLVESFESGKLPKDDMIKFTYEVNRLIQKYNRTPDLSEKEQSLKDIQNKIKQVEYKFPPSLIAESPGFREVNAGLFKEIQHQMASLGINSLLNSPTKPSPLAEVIANIAPDKADKLLDILVKGKNFQIELKELYPPEDKSKEAERFRDFLNNHEIRFLGGKNSKNFIVTNLVDNSDLILKVDSRLDMSRIAEAHLREELPSQFTLIEAERQVTGKNKNGETISRTLLVTENCSGGSVLDYSSKFSTPAESLKSTFDIFEQMANIMVQIQDSKCVFPDAKISNWLVDTNGKVLIADTKSFLFTDEDGRCSLSLPDNQYSVLLSSPSFSPPELYSGSFDADSTHAYILGKNLYIGAVGMAFIGDDGSKFDFDRAIFKEEHGPELRALIEALVKPNPADRMPVREALDELFILKNPEITAVFKELKGLRCGSKDEKMNDFIHDKLQDIRLSGPVGRANIINELNQLVKEMKEDKVVNEANSIVNNFKKHPEPYTMELDIKVNKIEKALCSLPIEERRRFNQSDEAVVVQRILASYHSLDIHAESTAKNFKNRFAEQIHDSYMDQENPDKESESQEGMKLRN